MCHRMNTAARLYVPLSTNKSAQTTVGVNKSERRNSENRLFSAEVKRVPGKQLVDVNVVKCRK